MRTEDDRVREPYTERTTEEEHVIDRPAWSPAQIIALIVGALFLAFGGIALARGGFDDMFAHTTVAGLHYTPIRGIVDIALGALLIAAGAMPGASRALMSLLGALALAGGIVVLIEPSRFHDALGTHEANGWVYLVAGLVLLVAAFASPVIFGKGRMTYRRR